MWTVRFKVKPENGYQVVSINRKIYLIHSYPGGKPTDVSVFDPASYRWDFVHTQPLPDSRPTNIHCFTIAAYGDCAYLWGGMENQRQNNAVYRLDTNTMTWSRPQVSGEVPPSTSFPSSCIVGHRMYVFLGVTHWLDFVRFLDLSTMEWHRVATSGVAPTYRRAHAASAIGSRMYIWGGIENGPLVYDNSLYYLETSTSTWVRPHVEGILPEARVNHAQFVYNGKVYIFGGFNGDLGTLFGDMHMYDPEKSCWSPVAPKRSGPSARSLSSCCVIGERVFVVVGRCPISLGPPSEEAFVPKIHVLDFAPTLKTLCSLAFLDAHLDVALLPPVIRNEVCAEVSDETISSAP